jgi:hypothetical protein
MRRGEDEKEEEKRKGEDEKENRGGSTNPDLLPAVSGLSMTYGC